MKSIIENLINKTKNNPLYDVGIVVPLNELQVRDFVYKSIISKEQYKELKKGKIVNVKGANIVMSTNLNSSK
jgi:hypothetical protein